MRKIASGRIDLDMAHAWFKRECSLPDTAPLSHKTPQITSTWHFIKRLVELVLPSNSEETVPHTFLFDEERLVKLRADIDDSINLEICMDLFRELDMLGRTRIAGPIPYDDTPATSIIPSPYDSPTSPSYNGAHSSPTLPQAHHFMAKTKSGSLQDSCESIQPSMRDQKWDSHLENDSIILSSTSSLQSSPSSTASTPDTYPPTPFYLSHSTSDSASQVRNSLIAILDPTMTSKRWTKLAPSLALQILRSTATPLETLPNVESRLKPHVSNPNSKTYQGAKQQVLSQLLSILYKLVETYSPLTCLQIFELAAVQKSLLSIQHIQRDASTDEITEIATKIAHIGMLHWRVWAPLTYLIDPNTPVQEGGLVT
jgi:hypothetical protein